jgi:hypothetical protein
MAQLNNPAAHLLKLLGTLCNMPETDATRTAFSSVFMVPDSDVVRLTKRIAEMAELVDRIEDRLRSRPKIPADEFLTWKPAVMGALGSVNLVGPLKSFTDPLKQNNNRALERLGFCAHILAVEPAEDELDNAALLQLKNDINALVKETKESDIDAELGVFLLYQLGILSDAIDEHLFFGRAPVEKAANFVMGSLILDREATVRMEETPVGLKFWKLFERFATAVSTSDRILHIAESFQKLLPHLHH